MVGLTYLESAKSDSPDPAALGYCGVEDDDRAGRGSRASYVESSETGDATVRPVWARRHRPGCHGVAVCRSGGGSVRGARLDPLTDKILIAAPLLWLAAERALPLWAIWLLLARELLISGWRAGQGSGGPRGRDACTKEASTRERWVMRCMYIRKQAPDSDAVPVRYEGRKHARAMGDTVREWEAHK